jgi:nucleoside-diphosphate-sugar epimerase
MEEILSIEGGITLIAGGEDFVTPPLYKKLTAGGGRCRVIDFSASLSRQRERRGIYDRLISPDAEVLFADPNRLGQDLQAYDRATALVNLSDIFSDFDYEAFPAEGLKRNALTALEIMESACRAKVHRVIHISSGVVYGSRKQQPLAETTPREAHDLQAALKIASEAIVESYGHRGKLETVILRMFNVYGPGQSSEAIVPYLLQGALSGKPLPMGNTNHTRDFLYIDDMVDGIIAAIHTPRAAGMALNLASGVETSIKSLIALVEELTGQGIDVTFDPERIRIDRPDFPRWVADISLAGEILGFAPAWDLGKGLKRTIESIKETAGRWR